MKAFIKICGSVRLTVILLAFSTLMVLLGTLAQANYGIHHAQEQYVQSWVVISPVVSLIGLVFLKSYPESLAWIELPLPGGLLLGVLLVLNLICGYFRYHKPGWRQSGIALIHGGIALLIVSGFLGSVLQEEWQMPLDEGSGPVEYLSAVRGSELAIVRTSIEEGDTHYIIKAEGLTEGNTIPLPNSGIVIRIEDFTLHSIMEQRGRLLRMISEPTGADGFPDTGHQAELLSNNDILLAPRRGKEPVRIAPDAQRGLAASQNLAAVGIKPTYKMDERNMSSAVVTVEAGGNPIGTWLTGITLDFVESLAPQSFEYEGDNYRIELRNPRTYLPFSLALIDFTHRRHPNTNIPAEFSSDIILNNPETGENRHVHISMNQPLRYNGYTFYQASFANDDRTSVLQVVRNPSWLLPYISIVLVGLGLIFHFMLRLFQFTGRTARLERSVRKSAPPSASGKTTAI